MYCEHEAFQLSHIVGMISLFCWYVLWQSYSNVDGGGQGTHEYFTKRRFLSEDAK